MDLRIFVIGSTLTRSPGAKTGAEAGVLATGAATVNGRELLAGDAVAVEGESAIAVTGEIPGEVLLFDLA